MLQVILVNLSLLAVVIVAYGVGDTISKGGRRQWTSLLERFIFGCSIGLGILSYSVFFLGILGILHLWAIATILAAGALVGGKSIAYLLKELVPKVELRSGLPKKTSKVLLAFCLFSLASFTMISAMAPPNAGDWDSLAYHLAIPKLYLEAQRIYEIGFSSHSNFPFTMEMLYTIGLALKSTALARLFHWLTGVLCCGTVFLLAKRHLNTSGNLALLIFAGIPLVAWEATLAYIDLGVALFSLLSAYSILNAIESRQRVWFVFSAVFAGLAAGTKMTALSTLFIFALWVGIETLILSKKLPSSLIAAFLYTVLALVVASPWYLKSLIWTGNPVFPFFYNIFGGKGWNADLAEMYRISQLQFGIGTDWINLIKMPYALAFHPERFYDIPNPMAAIGISFIVVLVIIFRLRVVQNASYIRLLVICFVQAFTWCFLTQQSRYLLPALAIFSPAAAYAILCLSPSKLLRWFLIGTVVIQFIWTLGLQGLIGVSNIPVVFGLQPKDEYLSRTLDNYEAIKFINEKLPENAQVVLFGDTRGFYLNKKYFWGDPVHNAIIPYNRLGSPSELAEFLLNRNYEYALVNERYLGQAPWAPPQAAGLVRGAIDEGIFDPLLKDSGPVNVYKVIRAPLEPLQ